MAASAHTPEEVAVYAQACMGALLAKLVDEAGGYLELAMADLHTYGQTYLTVDFVEGDKIRIRQLNEQELFQHLQTMAGS